MVGTSDSIFAIGDCTASSYAPTAQVASQQGAYLARQFAQMAKRDALQAKLVELMDGQGHGEEGEKRKQEVEEVTKQLERLKLRPFHYSHQGSLAYVFYTYCQYGILLFVSYLCTHRYIGSEKAIADLPLFNGNVSANHIFYASFYIIEIKILSCSLQVEAWPPTYSGGAHTSARSFPSAIAPWSPRTGLKSSSSAGQFHIHNSIHYTTETDIFCAGGVVHRDVSRE